MTVNAETSKSGPYIGNGSTVVHAYAFKVLDQSHIVVTQTVIATGVETVLTISTHYSVSGVGVDGGGNITMVTAAPTTDTVTITRAVPKTQTTDLVNRGAVQPAVIETALDRGVQQVQDFDEEMTRVLRVPISTASSVSPELPAPTALKTFRWNAAASGLEEIDDPGVSAVASASSASASAVSATNAAASETYVAARWADFNDRYLGVKTSAPTLDNDGNALADGSMYFDTTTNDMFVYDLGATTFVTVSNSTSATAAANSATASSTSATAAAASETAAAASETAAAASETAAAASETAAATSQSAAATSQSAAATSATSSATSATSSATSATNAAASYDAFDDRYLGSKASDPTLDNDGNALLDGAMYFNTTNNNMFVYDLGNTTFVSVSNAASSTAAAGSATAAATSATSSATSATNSATSATNSATSATNAASSATSTAALLDAFDDRYLGSKTSDPTLDNDGNALVDGALYFNTTDNAMQVYDLGTTAWLRMTPTSAEQTSIDTVSGISANVTNVGNDIANVNTVAANLASVNNFALTYRTGSSDPTTSLDDGDLFYNTTVNQLKVYNGSAWEAGVLAGATALIKANNLSDLVSRTTAQQNLGRWYSQTISANRTVAANTDFVTGADLVINNGITLVIPATSSVEVSLYAAGEVL
jgi:hypothetical protein